MGSFPINPNTNVAERWKPVPTCVHTCQQHTQHGGSSRGPEERKQENKISSLWLTARQAWLAGTWRGAQVPSGRRRTGLSLEFGAKGKKWISQLGWTTRAVWGRRSMAGQLTLVILVKLRELRKWKWEKQDCRKYKIDFCHCFCGHLLLASWYWWRHTRHRHSQQPAADKKMYATEFLATVRF